MNIYLNCLLEFFFSTATLMFQRSLGFYMRNQFFLILCRGSYVHISINILISY